MTAPAPPTRPDLETIQRLWPAPDPQHAKCPPMRVALHAVLDYALSLESELATLRADLRVSVLHRESLLRDHATAVAQCAAARAERDEAGDNACLNLLGELFTIAECDGSVSAEELLARRDAIRARAAERRKSDVRT